MTIRTATRPSTFATAGLLTALLFAGAVMSVQAGEGCTKDKAKETSSSAAYPVAPSTPA